MEAIDPRRIKCVVFDFGFTLSPDYYFQISPPNVPEWHQVFQEHIFRDPAITIPWMKGEITSRDVAMVIGRYIPLDTETILSTMDAGCKELSFNPAVWLFALMQKLAGRKIALVTVNMDVFTRVVVPAHKLARIFDVIVNSADVGEIRKEVLWPRAFEQLDNGIGYGNSLLIEDGVAEPAKFRLLGGYAHQYVNEKSFSKWVKSIDWDKRFYE
jgi:FMN phosphatase YigB (HAD superfamily)